MCSLQQLQQKVWVILRPGEPCRVVFEPSGFKEFLFSVLSVEEKEVLCRNLAPGVQLSLPSQLLQSFVLEGVSDSIKN